MQEKKEADKAAGKSDKPKGAPEKGKSPPKADAGKK